MAKVFIEETSLTAIGDAIRAKTGDNALMSPAEMAEAIEGITTGGGGGSDDCNGRHIPEEALTITGNCSYKFANSGWNWFIEQCGDEITTKDISNANNMFTSSKQLTSIPFDLNFVSGGCDVTSMFSFCKKIKTIPAIDFKQTSKHQSFQNLFNGCNNLEEIGKLSNLYPNNFGNMFDSCNRLRYLPEFENLNLSRVHSYAYAGGSYVFRYCYSLRSIPEELLKQLYNPLGTSSSYVVFPGSFQDCYVLDELRGVSPVTGALTSNVFLNTVNGCNRLKDFIFDTQEDGTPYEVNWKSQTLDLTSYVGYAYELFAGSSIKVLEFNSGITADKRVTDDTSYQALKNDPDWFTTDIAYSRYNHDSAVNTINSLPITTNTGCTIKFKGALGSATDGGAINTLTEEEIAVAAAKGWTVTLV
jgi:hypothetical protein